MWLLLKPLFKFIHRLHRLFGVDVSDKGGKIAQLKSAKNRVFSGKEETIQDLKKANKKIKLMIEKGEVEIRILNGTSLIK